MSSSCVKFAIISIALTCLSACAESEISSSELRNSISSARNQLADYADKMVLENILRARDFAPFNYSDLTAISDTASAQTTIDLSIPFGDTHSSTTRNGLSPGEVLSASPTASVSSLNSQGFVLAMMQPTNPLYLASKWNAGYDDEFLLYLFIKSIRFADSDTIVNDPSNASEYEQFSDIMKSMNGHIHIKTITVMEPLGAPIAFSTTKTKKSYMMEPSSVGSKPKPSSTSDKANLEVDTNDNDLTAVQLEQSFSEVQLHVGNICHNQDCSRGQVYREYPQQVVLCVDQHDFSVGKKTYHVYDSATIATIDKTKFAANPKEFSTQIQEAAGNSVIKNFMTYSFGRGGGAGSSSSSGGGSTPSTAGVQSSGGGTPSAPAGPSNSITNALSPNRIGAVVYGDACRDDELIEPPQSEDQFADSSAQFTQVEWRSPEEILDYLGALSRYKFKRGAVAAGEIDPYFFYLDGIGPGDMSNYVMTVEYDNYLYGIGKRDPSDSGIADQDKLKLQAVRILRELVDSSKLASSTSIPQPVLFVP